MGFSDHGLVGSFSADLFFPHVCMTGTLYLLTVTLCLGIFVLSFLTVLTYDDPAQRVDLYAHDIITMSSL